MAKYNEILAGRYNRFFQKLFQMKGPAPAPQLAGEIAPTLTVFSGAEMRWLESWERFGGRTQVAGVAAQRAASRLRNPPGSNVIAVIEKAVVSFTLADQPELQIGASTVDLSTLSNTNRLDPRGRAVSSLIISTSGTGATLSPISQCAIPANGTYDFITTDIQEIPLLPGDAIEVIATVVNQGLNVGWIWRERAMEQSELF